MANEPPAAADSPNWVLNLQNASTATGACSYFLYADPPSAGPLLTLYRQDGGGLTSIGTANASAWAVWDGQVHAWRIAVVVSGGNLVVSAYLDGVQIISGTHNTATLAQNPTVSIGGLDPLRSTVGHLAAWADTPPAAADIAAAILGHPREQAHTRIARVLTEESIPHSVTATESLACGPQPTADVLEILRDAELADHGILTESRGSWGINYRASTQRINLTAALTVVCLSGPIE